MDEVVALYAEGNLAGRVVGEAPRSRVRAENLPHAATAVLLVRGTDVYVHRRTTTKDVYPGLLDVWAGGVVLAGESIESAAARELAEELGVTGLPMVEVPRRFWWRDEHTSYLACRFLAIYDEDRDGPIRHQESEVAEGFWMPWRELVQRVRDPGWDIVPDGREGLRELVEHHPDGPL